jgi:hypothetical protein
LELQFIASSEVRTYRDFGPFGTSEKVYAKTRWPLASTAIEPVAAK